eukprot:2686561-Prymnesium_polylepis.1
MPVAGGQPVSIVQNVSGDLLDGGAELHHLSGDAGDRAGSRASTTTSIVQLELRGAHVRSSHR